MRSAERQSEYRKLEEEADLRDQLSASLETAHTKTPSRATRHRNVLYHVANDRHIRRRCMIFTTNKHPKRWGEVLHDDDLADASSIRRKHLSRDERQPTI